MSNDIHRDGSVDTLINWRPGGAQGVELPQPGRYLVAVYMACQEWHIEYMTVNLMGYSGTWGWDEIEWYALDIDLPFVEKRETK